MAIDLRDIRALHWQPQLSADGEIVEGLSDVAQAITIILTTRKGSDPHRPEFGSDIWQYIDWPVSEARPHVVREVRDAIARWEPRARITAVSVAPGNGRLSVRVTWRLAADVEAPEQTTEITP